MQRVMTILVACLLLAGTVLAQDGPPQGTNPLLNHELHVATSPDGLTWTTDGVALRGHTSVPEVVYWQDKLWIYAVEGDFDLSAGEQERLVILEQSADGWTEHYVTLDTPFDGAPVDPDAVVLDDGRLRLYFFDFSVMRNASPNADEVNRPSGYFYSMVSSDGVNFTLEEGTRLESNPPATDPDVVRVGDTWLLYGTSNGKSLIARSTDGLSFETIGEKAGTVTGTVVLDGGILRQYYQDQGQMVIDESMDGLNWTRLEVETGLRGGSPAVTMLPDGSWVMVYNIDPTIRNPRPDAAGQGPQGQQGGPGSQGQGNAGQGQGNQPPDGQAGTVLIFVVAEGINGPNSFGCGDSLVGAPSQIAVIPGEPATNVSNALKELLSIQTAQVGQSRFITALAGSQLSVQDVVVDANGRATINLSGTLSLSGTCADARVKYQLLATIFATPAVQEAVVLIDGQNLAQFLDMSGQATVDTVYTRDDIPFNPSSN